MSDLGSTSLNGAREVSSDRVSCEAADWQVAMAAAVKSTGLQEPAADARSTARRAPSTSAPAGGAALDPIQPESLSPGPLGAAAYEKVGARNKYLAGKYDPDSWSDRALNTLTGAMQDPANVLTASERSEHRALTAKIIETIFPQQTADEARLGSMLSSPIGTIAWLVTREAGGSQRAQDLALGIGRSAEGMAMIVGARAGLKFLNAQSGKSLPEGWADARPEGLSDVLPEELADAIRNVNSEWYWRPVVGRDNCVSCAVATDAVLGGRAASALSIGPKPYSAIQDLYKAEFELVRGPNMIVSQLLAAGPGARGIVAQYRRNFSVGHVFNAVNIAGRIYFIDGQANSFAIINKFRINLFLRTH